MSIALCLLATIALGENSSRLAQADNGFAFDLVNEVLRGHAPENVFLSPYGVSIALQMLCNGAAGKTRTEIQKALNTAGFSQDEINRFFEELNGSLVSQSNVVLDLANSIWVDKGFDLNPTFVSTNESVFGATVGSVNFEAPESADTINGWSSHSTRGKINRIVSFPFPAKTEVILANAIYFKGKWATPFDRRLTKTRYFHLAGGMIKQAPMMSRRGLFQYEAGDGFQAVELPYNGDRIQMILFLPATNSSPAQLLAAFNGKKRRDNILRHFLNRNGTVIFPKFKLNCQLLLNDPLDRLGMTDAFIPGAANFSGMSADPLFVSEVLQKAFVTVNEQGTVASAVTTVSVRATAIMRPLKPFEMTVDRPFVFMIFDKPTGAILFLGIVNDPTVQ